MVDASPGAVAIRSPGLMGMMEENLEVVLSLLDRLEFWT
jgi:hypothetical protein